MIYYVSNQQLLFKEDIVQISPEESLSMMNSWNRIQVDTETNGRDAHINDLLCIQFGNDKADAQIVVDTSTVDIQLYKELLESKLIIGHNLKFDLQFLYNYHITPLRVYDTMIVEQLLYLGYPPMGKPGGISYALKAVADRRLGIDIDKTVRGEIIWRGLDESVIKYAAGDVMWLEKILNSQYKDLVKQGLVKGALLENDFVPVIAYLEWCGIKLDESRWKDKMINDIQNMHDAENALNAFVINNPNLKQFTYIETQGDLFEGFDLAPRCTINWSSSQQVIPLAKALGFDTTMVSKTTGEDADSVTEKLLKGQKGINDEFLRLYYGKGEPDDDDYFAGYQGSKKVVTSFGQGHINAINPRTGRIHTVYRQLGCDTGRMSSGSTSNNNDLAKFKGLPINPSSAQKSKGLGCSYPNMQQLPHDEVTRACFVADKGNKWVSCDYSAIESRLGGDIYNEQSIINEFLHGSGDMHSLVAKMVFKELKDVPVKDIKKKYPHLRSKAKPIEFSQQLNEFRLAGE